MSSSFARGTRRRYVAVRAGTYPAPAPPTAASPVPRHDPSADPADLDPFADSLFEGEGISFAPSEGEASWSAPELEPLVEEPSDALSSVPSPTAAPAAERREGRRRAFGPTASGTLGMLLGASVGALVGFVLSTAMLALYAPTDFAQAILDPVGLWTQIEDWKVLAGAILIATGFAVLGAGQGAQRRPARD
ncbi:MAG: hypothetical protein MUE47_04175 [Acidobacteria bacterium]|nr:hypothetical protein [Acidobacteriota bacterium]